MGKIKNKLIFAFAATIAVLLLMMLLNSEYSKRTASTHKIIEGRIEPALNILHDFKSYNKELYLLSSNKIATQQDERITNQIKIITEVELPHLIKKTEELISSFPLDDTKLSAFKQIIFLSDDAIRTVKDILSLLQTSNDYSEPDKLLKAKYILNNKLAVESTEIDHAVVVLRLDFNKESRSKRAALTAQLNNLSKIILITSIIAILLSHFVAFKTIRSIVGPIQILKEGAKRISKGDYDHKVILKGKDELTMLGNNFNEMAESLNNSFDSINRKNKELEQFVYIASHDLQEPLRTIVSFTELLSEQFKGKLDEAGDEYIRFIGKAASRMQYLVKDLMDHSRLGSDKNLEVVDCHKLVLGVKDDLSQFIEDKGGQLVIGDLPKVQGYKTSLRLLFQNLINNAMKFQKPNVKSVVEIFYEDDQKFWKFGIKDNGIGIAAKNKERIFSIFKRLHSRDEYEGTGIGLAHCAKITELHGGSIWVTSELNKGSTFYFTLSKDSIK